MFIREHILPLNTVIVGGASLLAILDLLVPKTEAASRAITTATGCLAAFLLISTIFPKPVDKALVALGYAVGPRDASQRKAWRRPAWGIALALLLCFTAVGAGSVRSADKGGLLASSFPAMRELQEGLLSLGRDIASVQAGVDKANAKLDTLVDGQNDPQRSLATRGYPINSSGLMQAIKMGDEAAAGLFAKINLPVEREGVALLLLSGPQDWNAKVASALDASMFKGREACPAPSHADGVKEPAKERLGVFARLCGKDRLVAYLRDALAKPMPANADAYTQAKRSAQERNLSILAGL